MAAEARTLGDPEALTHDLQIPRNLADAPLARLIAGAPQTLGVPGGEITHVLIDRAPGANLADPNSKVTEPTVAIDAKDGRRSGHLTLTLAGEPLSVYPAEK
ncbi:hypothetical protein Ntsu_75100 [Nocardia sp. IFM 10818]